MYWMQSGEMAQLGRKTLKSGGWENRQAKITQRKGGHIKRTLKEN